MSTKWARPSLKSFTDITTENAPLARFTTFGIGGPARLLVEPRSGTELASVVDCLASDGIEYRILGGGANLLIPDEGVPFAVVKLAGDFAKVSFDGTRAEAGAAVPLGRLVSECAKRGLSGAEGLAGIPGTVGGALVMNAGGRWGRIGDVTESVGVLARGGAQGGPARVLDKSEIRFGYRESSLRGEVILGAKLAFREEDPAKVVETTRGFLDEKRRTQDLKAKSAGCVFKNPPEGPSAGALIDQAGLKGARVGGAAVSPIHANFIVNCGNATAREVGELINLMRDKVFASSKVRLELEIELW
jgi:UDP-N-acetylmuramate dehydrogenase